jgi:LuxR family transcriptional regulator, quorum-sensing system regulator BjaR1
MSIAQFAFDRIAAIERATTPSEVFFEIQRAATELGLDSFLVGIMPAAQRAHQPLLFLHNWPESWFNRYMERNYQDIDPILHKASRTLEPFAWSEVPLDRHKKPLAYNMMAEAKEFGLKTGFMVPVLTQSGDHGGVTFGCDRFEASPEARRALHMIGLAAYGKLRAIAYARRGEHSPPPKLSGRETEVLKWCSTGKSNSAIGEILAVAETTVETYVTRACRKLDACNRTQAVAEAIRHRLIF